MPNFKEAEAAYIKGGPAGLADYIKKNKNNFNHTLNDKNESYLHYAAREGKLDFAKALIAQGADKNLKNIDDATPLHLAAEQGKFELVQAIVENGKGIADINSQDTEGCTPLMKAIDSLMLADGTKKDGLEQIVEYFIQNDALKLDLVDGKKNNILHYTAAITKPPALIKIFTILKRKNILKVQVTTQPPLSSSRTMQQLSSGPAASLLSKTSALAINPPKIDLDNFINALNKDGETPLVKATEGLLQDNIEYLLEMGADPGLGTKKDNNIFQLILRGAIDLCAQTKLKEKIIVFYLIAMGCDLGLAVEAAAWLVDSTEKPQELHGLQDKIIALLIGDNPKSPCKLSAEDEKKIAFYLLALGVAPSGVITDAKYLIEEAKQSFGQFALNRRLQDKIASFFKQSAQKQTVNNLIKVLQQIVKGPETRITLAILDLLEIDNGDEMGRSLLHYAAEAGRLRHVAKLCEKGSEIDRADCEGNTPLHLAARKGQVDIVKYLYDKGAKRHKRNNQSLIPFQELNLKDKLSLGIRLYKIETIILLGFLILLPAIAVYLFASFIPVAATAYVLSFGLSNLQLFGIAGASLFGLAALVEATNLVLRKALALPPTTSQVALYDQPYQLSPTNKRRDEIQLNIDPSTPKASPGNSGCQLFNFWRAEPNVRPVDELQVSAGQDKISALKP